MKNSLRKKEDTFKIFFLLGLHLGTTKTNFLHKHQRLRGNRIEMV